MTYDRIGCQSVNLNFEKKGKSAAKQMIPSWQLFAAGALGLRFQAIARKAQALARMHHCKWSNRGDNSQPEKSGAKGKEKSRAFPHPGGVGYVPPTGAFGKVERPHSWISLRHTLARQAFPMALLEEAKIGSQKGSTSSRPL
uniref:Uncharacterized protein n=1 Tax=Trichuris muris TaxID=70415 RepID=A0A5S6QZF8_TRIMR